MRHHRGEVLIELRDDRFGLAALGDGGEAADVGEQHGHMAAIAAEARVLRVVHELLVDVLRDVAREETLHATLLAAFHRVLIGDAAEGGDRDGNQRVDHRRPRPSSEEHRELDDQRCRHDYGGERAGPGADEHGGHRHDQRGQGDDRGADARRGRRQEAIREDAVDHLRMNLGARHLLRERDALEIVEAGRRRADDHDLVAEDSRIHERLVVGQQQFLGLKELRERVRRERPALVRPHAGVGDPHAPAGAHAAIERRQRGGLERHQAIAEMQAVAGEADVGVAKPERRDDARDPERRHHRVADSHGRDVAPRDAVGIGHEQIFRNAPLPTRAAAASAS